MHVDEVLCHWENGRATWETSNEKGCRQRSYCRRKVDFFLDSDL